MKQGLAALALAGVLAVLRRRKRRGRVLIRDPEAVKAKLQRIAEGGFDKLQVVADFDRTITTAYTRLGEMGMSCHGILENYDGFSARYRAETKVLFHRYHPIERSKSMTEQEKIPHMIDWYNLNHEQLLKERLYKTQIANTVLLANTELRPGCRKLFSTLSRHSVPLLVFSAGLGDIIDAWLRAVIGPLPSNMHIISNWMVFDEAGVLVGFKEPLIHMFNKDDTHVAGSAFSEEVAARPNVLLLGDSLGDPRMATNCSKRDVVLRVGLLNSCGNYSTTELSDEYAAAFDVVLVGDVSFDWVNDLLATLK